VSFCHLSSLPQLSVREKCSLRPSQDGSYSTSILKNALRKRATVGNRRLRSRPNCCCKGDVTRSIVTEPRLPFSCLDYSLLASSRTPSQRGSCLCLEAFLIEPQTFLLLWRCRGPPSKGCWSAKHVRCSCRESEQGASEGNQWAVLVHGCQVEESDCTRADAPLRVF